MTNIPVHLGIAWYRNEADYKRCLALFIDRHVLPATFLEWQKKADQLRKTEMAQGRVVIPAYIDPDTFADWCRARGLNVDAKGRMAFGNAEAVRIANTNKS